MEKKSRKEMLNKVLEFTTKALLITAIALVVTVIGASVYMKNFYVPETVLKTAVKESELPANSYILCKVERTTGFDWLLLKNEHGDKTNELCNISGASPFADFRFRYEFEMSGSTFVFYVEEKRMVYSEATGQDEVEYIVTGWDILYPVKHEGIIFGLFMPNRYITEHYLRQD